MLDKQFDDTANIHPEACLGDTLDSLLQRVDVQLYKRKTQPPSV